MRNFKLAAALALGVSALGLVGLRDRLPDPGLALPGDAGAAGPELLRRADGRARRSAGSNSRATPRMVAQGMQAQGYVPAASISAGDDGRPPRLWRRRGPHRISTATRSATAGYGGYGGFGYGGFGRPYYSRCGYYGRRSPFYYGWNDPFWGFGWRRHRQLHRLSPASSTSTSAARPTMRRCSKATPRRARPTTISACSSPTWSKRCSPASPAARARRSGSPSRRRRARRATKRSDRARTKGPSGAIRAGLFALPMTERSALELAGQQADVGVELGVARRAAARSA